jgi:hypothetical protein
MRDDYRTRFAVLAECGYPRGADPHVFLLDIDACVTATAADAGVFDSLDQAAAAWREGKGDTARTVLPEPVTTTRNSASWCAVTRRRTGRSAEMSRAVTPITCSVSTAASMTSPLRWPGGVTSGRT